MIRETDVRFIVLCGLCFVSLICTGCATYTTPGRAVALTTLTGDDIDQEIADRMSRAPAARFPARLAVVRVQARNYSGYGYQADTRPTDAFSLVSVRATERELAHDRLLSLPDIAGVAMLNRVVLSHPLENLHSLRLGAASLKTDMLLVYTIDTSYVIDDVEVGPLQVISLGTLPTRRPRITATASAALVDVRTGFVYGLSEATAEKSRFASPWTTTDAVEAAGLEAERAAIAQLFDEFTSNWHEVRATHGREATISRTGS